LGREVFLKLIVFHYQRLLLDNYLQYGLKVMPSLMVRGFLKFDYRQKSQVNNSSKKQAIPCCQQSGFLLK